MKQLSSRFGASNSVFNHSQPNRPEHSVFPLGRLINLTAEAGQIVPADVFKVYPGDRIKFSVTFGMDTLPLIQPPLTRYKVLFHAYYMKGRDMWKGAKTMTTKGRSGNVKLLTPKIDLHLPLAENVEYDIFSDEDNTYDKVECTVYPESHHSLSAFIGVPPSVSGHFKGVKSETDGAYVLNKDYMPFTYEVTDDDTSHITLKQKQEYNDRIKTGFNPYRYVNALPFVMYQSICKNNYVKANLLQDNTALFPVEGDDDWLLPYSASVTNYIGHASNDEEIGKFNYNGVYSSDEEEVRLDLLRYSLFDDDYFTTGLPWLQRGDTTTLDLSGTVDFEDASLALSGFDGLINAEDAVAPYAVNGGMVGLEVGFESGYEKFEKFTPSYNASAPASTDYIVNAFKKLKLAGSAVGNLSAQGRSTLQITANQLRELLALSVWQERNARVDGSYNAMIYQHWKVNPHSEEHLPVYMGGTASDVQFSTIIQNSESTSSSPLGSTAGMGQAGKSSEICNNFYCEDYGYVMLILQIKPETVYMQGVERFLSCENSFEDIIFPEFQNLSPEPILVKELYVSDNDEDNDDLFAYQEPMTYAKVRQNVNRGLFQQKPDKDKLFASFTQARWFSSKPQLSYQFMCMCPENMRRDFLSYPAYPAFRLQISTDVEVVRALAYTSEAETFGF